METKFPSKRRRNNAIPWGYTADPNDDLVLLPIVEHLEAYEQAKEYIQQGCSYRDTARWLAATTESPMSHVGLFLKIKKEIRDRRSRIGKEAYQKKYGTQASSSPEAPEL